MHTIFWMLGALTSFCFMAIGARELSNELSIYQTLFFRSLIGFVIINIVALSTGKRGEYFSTRRFQRHVFRNIFHFIGQYGWFLGIGFLPLAEVFALEFTVPFWTLIIATVFLNEKFTVRKGLSIVAGLIGVAVIVKPGIDIIDKASIIVLISALGYSISHTATKSLSSTEAPITIVYYMCLIQMPIGLLLSLFDWKTPDPSQWIWLLIIGVTAMTAHYCMAKAMQYAEITTVVTLDFLRLPLIAIVGVTLYGEQAEVSILLGGALMLFGNYLILRKAPESRACKP